MGQQRKPQPNNVKAEDVPFAVPGQEKEREQQNAEETVIDALTQYADRELARLQSFTMLSNGALANMKRELEPLIETTLKEHPGWGNGLHDHLSGQRNDT